MVIKLYKDMQFDKGGFQWDKMVIKLHKEMQFHKEGNHIDIRLN